MRLPTARVRLPSRASPGPPGVPPARGAHTASRSIPMAKFHRTVPHYTDQDWAALKHRNGYTTAKDERFSAPLPSPPSPEAVQPANPPPEPTKS